MLNDKEFIKDVRSTFDLNLYEVKIWLALLSRGVSTAGELSTIANIPRSRAYDILDSLEKRGFVRLKMGKPIKYIAVSPEDVVQKIKKKIEVEAKRKRKVFEKLTETELMGDLSSLFKTGIKYVEPVEMSGLVKGRKNYHAQLSTMLENAEKNVTIVTTEPGVVRKMKHLKNDFKKASERGVNVKIMAPLNEQAKKEAENIEGVEFKHAGDLRGRFAVADGKDVVLMLMHDDEVHPVYDSGIWINSEFVGNALEKMVHQK